MRNDPQYTGKNTAQCLSPLLWRGCPSIEELLVGPRFGYHFFDQFLFYDGAGTGRWVETQATSGSVEQGDAAGGIITMDAGATTADQGIQIQLAGESFLPATGGKELWYEACLAITNTSNQFFAGLAVEDTTVFASGENSTANHLGFEMNATTIASDAGDVMFFGEKAGTRNTAINVGTPDSGATNFNKYGFHVYEDKGVLVCDVFFNNAKNATQIAAANIPLSEMTPTFVCQAEGTTQPVVTVDWVRVVQLR